MPKAKNRYIMLRRKLFTPPLWYFIWLVMMCQPWQGQSQVLVEDFETHTCPNTPCNGIIDDDNCLDGWSTSHGSPSIESGLAPAPPDEGNYLQLNSRSTFVDHHFGEGAFAAVDIQEGYQYRLSFTAYWEGDDNTTDVLRVSLAEGLAHNEPGSSDCLQEVGEADPTSLMPGRG